MERPLIVREQLIYPLVSFVFGGLFFRGGGGGVVTWETN